jgi:3-oxoacyl-[acyl-carrier protein] reductase
MKEKLLANKVALITGASGGIGREIAALFLEEGALLYLTYNKNPDLIKEEGNVKKRKLDFLSENISREIGDLCNEIIKEKGRIDIVVNGAGIWEPKPFIYESVEDYRRTLAINLDGPYMICKEVAKRMIQKGKEGGSIINISSLGAIRNIGYQAAYAASKGGLIALTKSLAEEFAKYNIRVNAIAPGLTDTPALDKEFDERGKARLRKTIPMDKLCTPKDVAYAALFLASDLSQYITGNILELNGGKQ